MIYHTYKDRNEAMEIMRIRNQAYQRTNNRNNFCVMVDGPEDDEVTLMDIRDAIDNDFTYTWEI